MLSDEIKKEEGLRLKPYSDSVGKLTIGYGLNLEDGIDQEEAEWLLQHRIERAKEDAWAVFKWSVFSEFPSPARDAFIHMIYQLGRTRFMGFKKMIEAAKRKDWQRVKAEALDSDWARNFPDRAARVVKGFDG